MFLGLVKEAADTTTEFSKYDVAKPIHNINAPDNMGSSSVIQRLRNEPLVEITQIKGTSDTHPTLSPNDEWANFEIVPLRVGTSLPSEPNGSYVRQALQNGLALKAQGINNPFQNSHSVARPGS